MRQILMRQTGGPEVLELVQAAVPSPGPGEVRVRAEAIGVGWPDILIRTGRYRWMPPLPTSPGSDLAGRIDAVGEGVGSTLLGAPVLITARELPVRGGCYTEAIVVPAAAPFVLPEGLDLDEAVCLPNYQVAWNLLHESARGRPVKTIFVTGVAGAIGSAVAQLARAAGITVFGSVSSEAKARFALAQGVARTIDYRRESVVDRLLEFTNGKGVDVVIDHVGGPGFTELFRMLAKWGTVVSYNARDGLPEANVLGALRANGARCPGLRIFEMHIYDGDREGRRRIMQRVIDAWTADDVSPVVAARFPLEAVRDAHRMIEEGRALGKVVLQPLLAP